MTRNIQRRRLFSKFFLIGNFWCCLQLLSVTQCSSQQTYTELFRNHKQRVHQSVGSLVRIGSLTLLFPPERRQIPLDHSAKYKFKRLFEQERPHKTPVTRVFSKESYHEPNCPGHFEGGEERRLFHRGSQLFDLSQDSVEGGSFCHWNSHQPALQRTGNCE